MDKAIQWLVPLFTALACVACSAVTNDELPQSEGTLEPACGGQTPGEYYVDQDGDGFGDDDESLDACTQPEGYVTETGDCDDSDPAVYPMAFEICDDVDHNCDGSLGDEPTLYYPDQDGDGFGDATSGGTEGCEAGIGWAENNSDCDDANSGIHPLYVDAMAGQDTGPGTLESPFLTIQAAINVASYSCGSITVNPGTYVETVEIVGFTDLIIQAAETAETTSIQSQDAYRPVTLSGVSNLILRGFNLTTPAGISEPGAALYMHDSSTVQLEALKVVYSKALGSNNGGGVAVENSEGVVISDCEFTRNEAKNGGGLACLSSEVTVSDCTFDGNYSSDAGGGAYAGESESGDSASTLRIENSSFIENRTENYGGAVRAERYSLLYVIDSIFQQNGNENAWGGAVYNPVWVERCEFIENEALSYQFGAGGGVFLRESATVTNSIFMGNVAYYAGALDATKYEGDVGSYYLYQNTFVDNALADGAFLDGGDTIGIFKADHITIQNNIIASFDGRSQEAIYNAEYPLDWVIQNNDVYVETGKTFVGYASIDDAMDPEHDNISEDPVFRSYTSGSYYSANLQLDEGSPCIDAGLESLGNDLDGSAPDMGAYGGPAATW